MHATTKPITCLTSPPLCTSRLVQHVDHLDDMRLDPHLSVHACTAPHTLTCHQQPKDPPAHALLPVLCMCKPTTAPAPITRMPGKVTGVPRPDHTSQKKNSQVPRSHAPTAGTQPSILVGTQAHQDQANLMHSTLRSQENESAAGAAGQVSATITWANLQGNFP